MAEENRLSFNLPDGEASTVYLVRLPGGRIVARTGEELAKIPKALRGEIVGTRPAEKGQ